MKQALVAVALLLCSRSGARTCMRGIPQVLQQLMARLADFDQYFEIMPGTRAVVAAPPAS